MFIRLLVTLCLLVSFSLLSKLINYAFDSYARFPYTV